MRRGRAILAAILASIFLLFLISSEPGRKRTALEDSGGTALFGENLGSSLETPFQEGGLIGQYLAIGDEFPEDVGSFAEKKGAALMLTIEPYSKESPEKSILGRVALGEFDGSLLILAKRAKAHPFPVLIRFGHEMNGNWYSWSGSANNRSPESYVSAYRKVRSVLCEGGCRNLRFVFSVNGEDVPRESWNRFENYYPGDEFVDFIGIDAFDWGEGFFGGRSPKEILKGPYERAARGYPDKPLLITEIGTGREKGRADWTRSLVASIGKDFRAVRGVFWFNIAKEREWALDSAQKDYLAREINRGVIISKDPGVLERGLAEG